MDNTPLRFQPWLRPAVWGGNRLASVLGKRLPSQERFGEAWEISDHPLHRSSLHGNGLGGQEEPAPTIRDLMDHHKEELLGPAARHLLDESFPWLIRFLDVSDWFSVRVQPDSPLVRPDWSGESNQGTAWFILAAEPGSRVYAGLLPGVGEKELRRAAVRGTLAECLHGFEPQAGDCLFLPAGTVHVAGGGVLIAEVQETHEATGCSRLLPIEETLADLDRDAGPVHPVRVRTYPQGPNDLASPEPARQQLVRCSGFHLDYLRQVRPFPCSGTGLLQALVVLHGRGSLRGAEGFHVFGAGETLLLPASLDEVWCHPEGPLGVLLVTLPSRARFLQEALAA
jgi:mannose-6-phosphate isomerase